MANRYLKNNKITNQEMPIKTPRRYLLIPGRIAIIKKTKVVSTGLGCRERETFYTISGIVTVSIVGTATMEKLTEIL